MSCSQHHGTGPRAGAITDGPARLRHPQADQADRQPWSCNSGMSAGMDEPGLEGDGHRRMAVSALRLGFAALAIAVAGLIVMSLRRVALRTLVRAYAV